MIAAIAKKPAKVLNMMMALVAFMLLCVVCLYTYATQFEKPYLYYQNLPFPAHSKVYPGQAVELEVERCNRTGTTRTYRTTHNIIDAVTREVTLLPNVEVSIEPGCHRSISRVNIVPQGTKPGQYLVSGVALVEGHFVTHRVDWYSEQFTVMAAENR